MNAITRNSCTIMVGAVMACLLPASSTSAALGTWDFTTDMTGASAPGVIAADATEGAGLTIHRSASDRSGTGEDLFVRTNTAEVLGAHLIVTDGDSSNSSNEAPTVAADDYWEFTITPDAGVTLNIDSISWDFKGQDVSPIFGPVSFMKTFARSSVDGYSSTLASLEYNNIIGSTPSDTGDTGYSNVSSGALGAAYNGLTGPVNFRIYFTDGIDDGNHQTILRIDNIRIEGTAIPEPASLIFTGMGAVAMMIRRRP